MLLVLLRIEQTFARDMGKNIVFENLNPKFISEDHARLLGTVQKVQDLVDSQYRHYSERSTGMVKRYLREATSRVINQALPGELPWEFQTPIRTRKLAETLSVFVTNC